MSKAKHCDECRHATIKQYLYIEQIAYEQASREMLDYFSKEQLAAFLHRCLSKLAENEVEPVAFAFMHLLIGELYGFSETEHSHGMVRLYTETQLITAQQRTAAWKDAVEDELVICGILNDSHKDPRKAVMDIALWHSEVAVDPAVSQAAIDLQQRTAEACARYCAQTLSPSKTIPDDSGRAWIAGTIHCADGIRNGEWREYL